MSVKDSDITCTQVVTSNLMLQPQVKFDTKWRKCNLQDLFVDEELCLMWNELVKDGEISSVLPNTVLNNAGIISKKGKSSKHYCGLRNLMCDCCDGICGPDDGCNCSSCRLLDKEENDRKLIEDRKPPASKPVIDSWIWGLQPDSNQLKSSLKSLLHEQWQLCTEVAGNTLTAERIKQRLIISARYFVALSRKDCKNVESAKSKSTDVRFNRESFKLQYKCSSRPADKATHGLARVGCRAALSFAFAFMTRSWKSGEDVELCSDLLKESLDALRSLPEATLFDESSVSGIWLEMVDRTAHFLHSVVTRDGNVETGTCAVPVADQHLALCLLLELAIQHGSLKHLLKAILLLLSLWNNSYQEVDNRVISHGTSAPLLPVLKRFGLIQCSKSKSVINQIQTDVSPTECFLRFLILPDGDDDVSIDLQQAAVVIMSHLDRLASPYLPPLAVTYVENIKDGCLRQQVFSWGKLAWVTAANPNSSSGPQICEGLCDLNVDQLCASERCLLILAQNVVYTLAYTSPTS
ncbi:Uncharacterised protein at_DN1722, partial [Pycnogonum litorale]